MTTRKKFDCVEMKHQAASKVQAYLSTMTIPERIAYLHKISVEFRSQGKIPKVPDARRELPRTGTES